MLKWLAVLLATLCGGVVCSAQNSAQLETCMRKATSQNEMDHCASEEAARAKQAVNKAYVNALSKMSGDPNATAKLKAFESAWIIYRDRYMNAMYPANDKQAAYGSIYPMEADLLWARLSSEQAKVLTDILKEYEETQ